MLGKIQKLKARTVFSGMIYLTWCIGMVIEMCVEGQRVPDSLNAVVMAQLAFYYGNKVAKKSEVKDV